MAEDKMDGFYRALVVDSKDPQKKGRVKIWIPDSMPEINPKAGKGIWAMAGNNPVGGRNSEFGSSFGGSCMVPTKNSYVWVFFEKGNPNRPVYTGAADLQGSPALPECQTGNYDQKWVPFKSPQGRAIVMSDDPGDERIEITGKKRQMGTPPSGDTGSVTAIDGNQSSILLDERNGSERILIRTRQGDFLNIDVVARTLSAYFDQGITLKSGKDINISAEGDVNIVSHGNTVNHSDGTINTSSGGSQQIASGGEIQTQSTKITQNTGASPLQIPAVEFKGNRNIVVGGAVR